MMGAIRMGLVLCGLWLLSACEFGITLAEPPNLYSAGTNFPADQVSAKLRTAQPTVFYVTDRARDGLGYGPERSASMAFGAAQVSFGTNLTWDELVARTHYDTSGRIERLSLLSVDEMVRFPMTPVAQERKEGRLQFVPEAKAQYDARTAAFQAALRDEIAEAGNRRLLIYVHGFNNDFEDALTTLSSLWHFSGRETVPLAFTWPAGAGGGPLGYFRDRDSGQFAVYHAKEFLRMLAEMPEVEQIDIVAHSRGSDVITTALRELIIQARGAGKHPKLALKTGTFIMAAPDLDVDIVRQRLAAERFSEAFEQINMYTNPSDRALRISGLLTQSTRLGSLKGGDFSEGEIEALNKEALVSFIQVTGVRGGFGHSYFRSNPAVLSDIVLVLRTRAFPGGELRPMVQNEAGLWVLHPNYPLEKLPDLSTLEERARIADER